MRYVLLILTYQLYVPVPGKCIIHYYVENIMISYIIMMNCKSSRKLRSPPPQEYYKILVYITCCTTAEMLYSYRRARTAA